MIYKITRLFFFILLIGFTTSSWSQVIGNKQIRTRTYSFESFSSLSIATPAEVIIDAQAEKSTIEISTDTNIFSHLEPEIRGTQVTIEPDTWIEPSELRIQIRTPKLEVLKTGGYGMYLVNNLHGSSFLLENPVGMVSLNGQVDQVIFKMSTGKLDARQLKVESMDATIESFGMAQIDASAFLHASIWGNGTIIYQERPARIDRDLSDDGQLLSAAAYQKIVDAVPPPTVTFRLRNNSPERIQAMVRGPKGNRFGYGFALNAHQKRPEEWPVGTQVFQVDKLGLKKLLVTIGEEQEGQVVDLF